VVAIRPMLAGSKPISLMNSFSTGTQSRKPLQDAVMYSAISRRCNECQIV